MAKVGQLSCSLDRLLQGNADIIRYDVIYMYGRTRTDQQVGSITLDPHHACQCDCARIGKGAVVSQ